MKRKLLLFLGAVAVSTLASAQYYMIPFVNAGDNPGDINNEDEQPLAYLQGNYTGYSQVLGPSATGWSGAQTIPFSFDFNGQSYTSYDVNASGVVTFTSNPTQMPTETNEALPSTNIPDNSICAWGLNLSGANDAVVSKTFGTAPNRQHWVIWASVSSNELGTGWSYWGIVLEETSNRVYVVDMRSYSQTGGNVGLTVGIQYNNSSELSVAASPNVASTNTASGGNQSDALDNTYYMFAPGTQPQHDLDNMSISVNSFVPTASGSDIKGFVRNLGSQAITEFEMEYSVDGGAPVTGTVTGVNIPTGGTYEYTHPTQWTPGAAEIYEIATSVISVNGNQDGDNTNDDADGTVNAYTSAVDRMPLVEVFTSSTCPPCVAGNQNMQSVLDPFKGSFSKINYQMSWPGAGDPYFTDEGANRRFFYGVNSVPWTLTDGVLPAGGSNSQSYVASDFTNARDVDSYISIDGSASIGADFNYAVENGELVLESIEYDQTVVITSMITPNTEMLAGEVAYMAVTEDTTFDNVGTNGETEFHDVFKKILPQDGGQSLPALTAGQDYDFDATYEFKGNYRLPNDAGDPINHATENSIEEWNDLRVVIWVQGNDGYVWQSFNTPVEVDSNLNYTVEVVDGSTIYTIDGEQYEVLEDGSIAPVGVSSIAELTNIHMYPNPANDIVNFKGLDGQATIKIFDMSGRLVTNQTASNYSVSVADLQNGVYNVVIEQDGAQTMKRLTIAR